MSRRQTVAVEAEPETGEMKPGYLRDYVTGVAVKASPEEIEAVQVFAQRLVQDYGYPKSYLQTRPQYRVRKRPSDEAKAYPVDIAVFKGAGRNEAPARSLPRTFSVPACCDIERLGRREPLLRGP